MEFDRAFQRPRARCALGFDAFALAQRQHARQGERQARPAEARAPRRSAGLRSRCPLRDRRRRCPELRRPPDVAIERRPRRAMISAAGASRPAGCRRAVSAATWSLSAATAGRCASSSCGRLASSRPSVRVTATRRPGTSPRAEQRGDAAGRAPRPQHRARRCRAARTGRAKNSAHSPVVGLRTGPTMLTAPGRAAGPELCRIDRQRPVLDDEASAVAQAMPSGRTSSRSRKLRFWKLMLAQDARHLLGVELLVAAILGRSGRAGRPACRPPAGNGG